MDTGFLWILFVVYISAFVNPSEGVPVHRTEILNPKYKVEWATNADETTIEFALTVETTGFIGFGLSLSGKMAGADMVIGGVYPNSTTYFNDYHGEGTENGAPTLDAEQNWELLEASESVGKTFLRFSRLLDTCDEEDIQITKGTVKLIWSFGETDEIGYHKTTRGALAVNMLDPPLPPVDLTMFNFTNFVTTETLNSEQHTMYRCSMHKRSANSPSHIVAFKPKLDEPNALIHTHHFNMYKCTAPTGVDPNELFGPYVGRPSEDCFVETSESIPRQYCETSLYAWSLGGRILVFPDDIGFPWGDATDEYFFFEVHVNNPDLLNDITFDTGVVIYDTDVLREKEAGMMSIGLVTTPSLVIPPKVSDWKLVGHCSSDCTKNIEGDGITIFNINLHAHLSGRKMRLRQFRDGVELPWIANDETYDADYQENRPMSDPMQLLPGDHVSLECTYDSNWKSPQAVIGGPATTDEMCNLFAFYYPKTQLESCYSGFPKQAIFDRFGIVEIDSYGNDPLVLLPEKWANMSYNEVLTNEIEWTTEFKASLQTELLESLHIDYCFVPGQSTKGASGKLSTAKIPPKSMQRQEPTVTYPDVEAYEEPERCQNGST